jgi:hypothetical protein
MPIEREGNVANERSQERRALEVAETRHRAFKERYFPVAALGARAAEPMTEAATEELARLEAVCEAARRAWRDALAPD